MDCGRNGLNCKKINKLRKMKEREKDIYRERYIEREVLVPNLLQIQTKCFNNENLQ